MHCVDGILHRLVKQDASILLEAGRDVLSNAIHKCAPHFAHLVDSLQTGGEHVGGVAEIRLHHLGTRVQAGATLLRTWTCAGGQHQAKQESEYDGELVVKHS